MSVSIQTVEFERREAHLSELEGEPPYTVHGVALGEGDVTVGQSGIKKLWPGEELREAAETLQGTNLVEDHNNGSRGVVGRVTKAGYKEGVGVIYEAELYDEDLAENVANGLLEVSIRGHHIDVDEMEEHEETGAKIVEGIEFANLSIVPTGAAPSNSIDMGETDELSVAELAAFTEDLQGEFEPEAGDYVQWGDGMYGIVLTMPDGGEVEVDVYEESDGEYRPIGETEMVSVGDLEEWDVDEDNIGPMEEAQEFLEWWDNQSSQSGHNEDDEEEMEEAQESADEGDNESDVEELQETEVHRPDFSGTTTSDWSKPNLEDFGEDPDMSEVADHFLVSVAGFPPENYGELKLPVVEPNGDLNLNALQNAKARASQTDGLSGDDLERAVSIINSLANEEFDADFEENAAQRPRTIDDTGDEPNVQDTGPVDIALNLINKYLRIEGNHERDSVDGMLAWLFGSTDIPSETVADFRVAANTFLDQTPGTDTFDGMTVEQFRDWLLMHGDGSKGRREQRKRGDDGNELPPGKVAPVHVLTGDDLRQGYKSEESELDEISTKVINMTEDIEEKLAELDEPVAVEQSELEDLQEKADQFEDMNTSLEDLRERTEILDSVDREQVEELADSDEPVVIESARYEALSDEAEQVKGVYAAALAEAYDVFDAEELTDRFSIEELREKYEENIGDPEEELAPEPRSGDPEEEELEEQANQEEEEQLSEEEEKAAEKRAELREKILGGR